MKKIMKGLAVALGAVAMIMPSKANAQDEFTVSGKADFVSNYIWRGMDQNSGFSIQPNLGLSYKGFTLAAWGSQSLTNFGNDNASQEFDINLSYSTHGFTIMISDLWWAGTKHGYGYYENKGGDGVDSRHHFEGTLSYNFSENCNLPLTLSWSTWFAGGDVETSKGNRCFSTYINAAYDIACPFDITLTPSVGFTPWEGYYHNKAAFTDLSLKATKGIAVTENFSIPLFVQAVVAPQSDHTYLVAGFSLGF